MSSSAASTPGYTEEERANRIANQGLLRFVESYRQHAHLQADLDPLGMRPKEYGIYMRFSIIVIILLINE
jgi:2-oxoglutarate dehydrogenase complex dehydrogenase (E1) component-like enzyme